VKTSSKPWAWAREPVKPSDWVVCAWCGMVFKKLPDLADSCAMCGWDGDRDRERSKEEVIHLINYHQA